MEDNLSKNNQLIIDNVDIKLYRKLINNLKKCNEFIFNVSFVKMSGVQLLLETLKEIEGKTKGKILTSNYMDSTEIEALNRLKQFKNIDIRVFNSSDKGFHNKNYIFNIDDNNANVIIGSSNLTGQGIWQNYELNNESSFNKEDNTYIDVMNKFNKLWQKSNDNYDNLFLDKDLLLYKKRKMIELDNEILLKSNKKDEFNYNEMQLKALQGLDNQRRLGSKKALVIAATGTGKTYLAALDAKQMNANKILFIVHRHEIIKDAKKTFKNIFKNNKSINEHDDKIENYNKYDIFFITTQTLDRNQNYKKIDKNYFDYIIIDECHHCAANSYAYIFEYFNPSFLLGLTATPERYDGKDIYEKFDYSIGAEIRLKEALDKNLLCSFHYFGANDTSVDWSQIKNIDNVKSYESKICNSKRVEFILDKLNFYGFSGSKRRCLCFCASQKHAEFMNNEFKNRGLKSECIISTQNKEKRKEILNDFSNDKIEYLFCVDILNEGIDVPNINTILMLRPTESPTIFLQQLGRGLRKNIDKDFLTVIDFIGNHKNITNIAFAFNDSNLLDKETMKRIIENDFESFSSNAFIQIDEISKQYILDKIEKINIYSRQNLISIYKEWKKQLKNEIPSWLDLLKLESSIDVSSFINISDSRNYNKSYLKFLLNIVNENIDVDLSENNLTILTFLESFIPIRRIDIFCILEHIVNNFLKRDIDLIDIKKISCELNLNNEDVKYVVGFLLTLKQFSKNESSYYLQLVKQENENYYLSNEFKIFLNKLKNDLWLNKYINEFISYSKSKYKQIENDHIKINNLFIGRKYSRNHILEAINYNNSFSSLREGVKEYNGQIYIFITLNKKDFKNENHKYKDDIIDKYHLQWESQSQQTTSTKIIKKIINTTEMGTNLNVFIRKNVKDKSNNETNKYIYLGKAFHIEHSSNKPVKFKFRLLNPIDNKIWNFLKS